MTEAVILGPPVVRWNHRLRVRFQSFRRGAGSIVIAAIEGELTARPFTAIDGEDAHVGGVVAGVVRSLP